MARCGQARPTTARSCVSFASPAPADGSRPALAVKKFGVAQGIPDGGASVFNAAGTPAVCVGTEGIYAARFDAASGRFVRDPAFDAVEADPLGADAAAGVTTGPDGRIYVDFGRGTVVGTKRADGTWDLDHTTFSRFGRGTNLIFPEPDGVVWLGREGRRLVRFDTRRAQSKPAAPFPALIRRVTVNHDRDLFGGGAAAGRAHAGRRLQRAADRVRRAGLHRRVGHVVPVAARRPRDRLVGVDARGAARLHQPGLRRLPLPRARARRVGRGERGSRLRVHDPAALVPHVARLRRLHHAAGAGRVRRRPPAAASPGGQGARARAVCRSEAARRIRRGAGALGERRQEERRAAQRDRPRDHLVARLRHDLRQALRARQPARRRRRLRRRAVSPGETGDRVPPGDREGQALRAVLPRHDGPRPVAGLVHRAPRAGLHQRPVDGVPQVHHATTTSRAGSSKTARCRSSRSRSSTCRSSPRSRCSASSRSRASRSTPTPSIT